LILSKETYEYLVLGSFTIWCFPRKPAQTIFYSYPQNELARKLESAYNMLMIYVCENQTNTWKQWEGKKWSLSVSLNVWYLQSVFFGGVFWCCSLIRNDFWNWCR
jgi:hypothetical protein